MPAVTLPLVGKHQGAKCLSWDRGTPHPHVLHVYVREGPSNINISIPIYFYFCFCFYFYFCFYFSISISTCIFYYFYFIISISSISIISIISLSIISIAAFIFICIYVSVSVFTCTSVRRWPVFFMPLGTRGASRSQTGARCVFFQAPAEVLEGLEVPGVIPEHRMVCQGAPGTYARVFLRNKGGNIT